MVSKTGLRKQTRWVKAKAAEVLEAQRHSGLSMQDYADKEGIDCQRLHRWARRLRVDNSAEPFAFVPVSVGAQRNAGSSQIEIATRSGQVARLADGFNASTLRSVLSVLEASC